MAILKDTKVKATNIRIGDKSSAVITDVQRDNVLFGAWSSVIIDNGNPDEGQDPTAWNGLEWSPELGLFCVVGNYNAFTNISTSSDGINWTSRGGSNIDFNNVAWSSQLGLFCAVGDVFNGFPVFATSPDGINWTTTEYTAAPAVALLSTAKTASITWSPELGLFLAVGCNPASPSNSDFIFYISSDGLNWSHSTYNFTAEAGTRDALVRQGGPKWIKEKNSFYFIFANSLLTSSNGIDWQRTGISTVGINTSATWSSEQGIFCNNYGISLDGITWTASTGGTSITEQIDWISELGCFFTFVPNVGVKYSTNGLTWSDASVASNLTQNCKNKWVPEFGRIFTLNINSAGSPYIARTTSAW